MLGSLFLFLLSLPQGEKEGKWGWKSLFYYNFFNSTYPEISKKIGFRGSAFPFPPSLS